MFKSILISNQNLEKFAGSELNTFDIANYFKDRGYHTNVLTFNFANPLKELFDLHEIQTVDLFQSDKSKLIGNEYDIIWAQDTPTLNFILFNLNINYKKIIFSSLSPFEPLAAPPLYINQLDKCLANSKETQEQLIQEGVKKEKILIFNNSVAHTYFSKYKESVSPTLQKVAIISNHLPKEVKETKRLLKEAGVEVIVYGLNYNECFVQPEHLLEVDAVITIGKTVQYALALGLPVYCYDHFGGPGWIHKKNYKNAEYYNYSGRCCNRRISDKEVFNELIEFYPKTIINRLFLHNYAKSNYNLENNINEVLSTIQNNNLTNITGHKSIKRHNDYYIRLFNNFLNTSKELDSLNYKKNFFYNEMERVSNALLKGEITPSSLDPIQFMIDRIWSIKVTKEELKNQLIELQLKSTSNEIELNSKIEKITRQHKNTERDFIKKLNASSERLIEEADKGLNLTTQLNAITSELEETKLQLELITKSRSWKVASKLNATKTIIKKILGLN